jgi:CheY-like chemotaxis protein
MSTISQPTRYKKVLIIDDDQIDIYISERILRSALFAEDIVSKSNATDALNYLKSIRDTPENLPCLIFLDLGMPAMDGFDFLVEFGKLEDSIRSRSKIVILSTSLNYETHAATIVQNNPMVKKFLNKPLTAEALEKIWFFDLRRKPGYFIFFKTIPADWTVKKIQTAWIQGGDEMKNRKKNIEDLYQLIVLLDKEHFELCNVHFKKAAELLEVKFSSEDYPEKKMVNLQNTIRALDRDIKLKNQSDYKYYHKLIATAINHLKEIHQALYVKFISSLEL